MSPDAGWDSMMIAAVSRCENRPEYRGGVYDSSILEHPFYQQTFGWRPEDYPNALRIGRQTVSLPISAKLSVDEVRVIEVVLSILGTAER